MTFEKKISILIPTCNENDDSYLLRMAQNYPSDHSFDYWVIDTGTPQSVLEKLNRKDFNILRSDSQTRAGRMNEGIKASNGEFILFNHPRSLLDPSGLWFLKANWQKLTWGGFTHSFDKEHLGLKWTSFYSNALRPRLFKILYLDHCIFCQRELLNQAIPDIPIFEDTELSKILMKSGPPTILPFASKTSSVRFEKNGFWKQALLNQALKIGYHIGRNSKKMNDVYEENLNLNG